MMTLFPIETVKPKAASAPDHCTSICHRRPNSDARDATSASVPPVPHFSSDTYHVRVKRAGGETALPSSPLLLLSADSDFEFHSNAADAIEMLFRFYTPNRFKPALLAGRRILKNCRGWTNWPYFKWEWTWSSLGDIHFINMP